MQVSKLETRVLGSTVCSAALVASAALLSVWSPLAPRPVPLPVPTAPPLVSSVACVCALCSAPAPLLLPVGDGQWRLVGGGFALASDIAVLVGAVSSACGVASWWP